MVDHAAIARHGYHHLRVARVVEETADSRSFVLDVPDDLREAFRYEAGQFCTFRVHADGQQEHARCYSMSSAPEVDADLTVTVKRVPGGIVSNWLIDHVRAGDELEVTRPAGTFRAPGDGAAQPVIGFCGGSGVTPVISIAKHALATTGRPVRLLYANRDRDSVIFDAALAELRDAHPGRLAVHHHLDDASGFLDAAAIAAFVGDDLDAGFCICGPGPFMDLVESTLLDLGVDPGRIAIERFVAAPATAPAEPSAPEPAGEDAAIESIVVILKGKKHELTYRTGDTVLESARRNGVSTPYSCEAGSCATCMGLLRTGAVRMKANDALEPDEVEEGWVLTCQSVPTEGPVVIEYEPL